MLLIFLKIVQRINMKSEWDWVELNNLKEHKINLDRKDEYRCKDISYEKRKKKANESQR